MLFPQSNSFRQTLPLPAFWDFRFDPDDIGIDQDWSHGFSNARPIAVPASWNEQFEEGRDDLGPAWYQVTFDRPRGFEDQTTHLRFGSVNYLADVWLNGIHLGQHEGGHLPFEFDASAALKPDGNLLVVRVDGRLAPDRVPPGNIPPDPLDTFPSQNYPNTSFDFFPYCGIHRPVYLYSTPPSAIGDISVTTDIQGTTGLVSVKVTALKSSGLTARFHLSGHGTKVVEQTPVHAETTEIQMEVPGASFWAPGSPHLYDLTVELIDGDQVQDRYHLRIGIRTVKIEGDQLLLNDKPIKLVGFGRHEDFPIIGRGLFPPAIIKDYALMKWVGANSFRTTHYPYSEEMMSLADELGFLVIDETPAVGLFFQSQGIERRLELCRQYTRELIERDRNHPCVIMWSLANEPQSRRAEAKPFFRNLYDLAKSLDTTRPVTVVSCYGVQEESFEFLDVVCMNRYFGWYSQSGQLELGAALLAAEIEAIHERFPKPFLMTEFGADTIPGHHAQPPEMFSEEYQRDFLELYINTLNRYPFVVGQHVWNLCDFKTGQAVQRMGAMNYKGVFTRDRRPKLAAHLLRRIWGGENDIGAKLENSL
jgi:beta-glucuronidase